MIKALIMMSGDGSSEIKFSAIEQSTLVSLNVRTYQQDVNLAASVLIDFSMRTICGDFLEFIKLIDDDGYGQSDLNRVFDKYDQFKISNKDTDKIITGIGKMALEIIINNQPRFKASGTLLVDGTVIDKFEEDYRAIFALN